MDDVGSGKGYVLSLEEMRTKALEAQKLGADQIFLQGGVNPDLPLEYYLEAIHWKNFYFLNLLEYSLVFSQPPSNRYLGTYSIF